MNVSENYEKVKYFIEEYYKIVSNHELLVLDVNMSYFLSNEKIKNVEEFLINIQTQINYLS